MDFKTFLSGLLLLVLAPILVIGGFAAYTYWVNAQPQTGLLHSKLEPQILFTGERATYSITFKGNSIPKPSGERQKPLDMIFVVDISSSMDTTLPEMVQAAHTVAQELANYAGTANLALVPFNTSAHIEVPWTGDANIFHAGLNQLTAGGLTDGLASFPSIEQLLSQARPDAEKLVVFYTDGQVDHVDEMARQAESLRQRGTQLFTVITPGGGGTSNMIMVMDDPARVLVPTNVKDLTIKFRTVADQVTGIYGYGAQLLHYIDGRNFSIPLDDEKLPWRVDSNANALQLNIGYLPYRSVTYQHDLMPKSWMGLWTIGLKPPQINFLDQQNQPKSHAGEWQPRLLILNWWLIFFAFLPALWWIFSYIKSLLGRRKPEEAKYIPPSIRSLSPPSPLPFPPLPERQRKTVIPTLFIGIGGAGHNALYATQEALKDAHLEDTHQPYHFMWLDLNNAHEKDEWKAFPIEKVIAPTEIHQVDLPQGKTDKHLRWFNARQYLDAPQAALNLSQGAKGQRDLARLALFRWLETGKLLPTLEKAYQKLLAFDSVDDTRQIVLFADRTGGVGSGWLVDIARLLRRLARQKQNNNRDFTPEIVGVLCAPEYPEEKPQKNQQALDLELDTAQMTGAFPQQITYHASLAKTDTEAPFNWLFSITEPDSTLIAPQCAQLSAVLVERQPRQSLLAHRETSSQISSVHINSLHVLPDLDLQLIKSEIFLRILGQNVLLDLEPDPAGKLAIRPFSEQQTAELLAQWIASEPKGTPWRYILQAAQDEGIEKESQFMELIEADRIPGLEWFQQTFTVSLNRQLWGWHDTGRWIRDWMPGKTIAALRFLAKRLESVKVPQYHNDKISDIIEHVISLATNAADQLQIWLDEFAPLCESAWEERHSLEKRRAEAEKLENVLIELSENKELIKQWADQAMQDWLSQIDTPSVDVTSALRERFFFSAQIEKGKIKILLSAYVVDQAQAFDSAKPAVAAIESYANQIAQVVPTLTVEGALLAENDKRGELARHLANNQRGADQALVVIPTVTKKMEKDAIDAFSAAIPTGNLQPRVCFGDDHSAIRYVGLKNERSHVDVLKDLSFIQDAEQTAERVRRRAIAQFKLNLPAFPSALRIALSHPEAFRSFANAYQAGHIVKHEDETGESQWFFTDQGEFITFGKNSSLAAAAANYVYYIQNPPNSFDMAHEPGDFERVADWQKTGSIPDEDLLVLIAMKTDE